MSVQFNEAHAPRTEPAQVDYEDWDLDVSIVESGPSADMLIR